MSRSMTNVERNAIKKAIRSSRSYVAEVEFLRSAQVVRVSAQLRQDSAPTWPRWTGYAILSVAGGAAASRRVNLEPGCRVPLFSPVDAIRFDEIEREFEGMRGQFSGAPPRLRSILVRMLEADCKQDLARLLNEVQTKLNDPAHLQQAWAKHEKRAKGSEAAAKKRRLEKLFNVTLVRAVEDGVEEEELVDAFRTAMAKQIMDV